MKTVYRSRTISFIGCDWLRSFNKKKILVSFYLMLLVWWLSDVVKTYSFWVLLTVHKNPGFCTEEFCHFKQLLYQWGLSEVCLLLLWLSITTGIEVSWKLDNLLHVTQHINNSDITSSPTSNSFAVKYKFSL